MKTAISIPDPIFEQAELVAKDLSLSRSELYTKAVQAFIDGRLGADVTERLNEIYAKESSSVDPVLVELQAASLLSRSW